VDARNQADSAIHGAEKGLKDFGDKVGQADRDAIQGAIDDLKATLEVEDAEAIATKTQALIQASMKLGEAMYKAQQEQQGAGAAEPQSDEAQASDDVVDAEFEEVDGDEKKSA
jgi:molecular chaperone DnaK